MKKSSMLLFSLLITLIASFIISDNVEAKSFSSVTEYAQYFKKYGDAFTPDGATVSTNTPVGLKYANVQKMIDGYLFFGGGETYTSIFGSSYGANEYFGAPYNAYRFLGVTYKGLYPYASNNIDEDYPSDGETGKRKYVYWRGAGNLTNNYRPKGTIPWNDPVDIYYVFSSGDNKAMSKETATSLYKQWIDNFEDHYSDVKKYKNGKYGRYFTRTEEVNLWPTHSFDKRSQLAFIIMPPTTVTFGRFVEWHQGCNAVCYDVYNIGKINGDDFVASKLDLTKTGTGVNIKFTVTYTGEKDRELPADSIDKYVIKLNGNVIGTIENSLFGTNWKAGESKTVDVGNVDIGTMLGATDELEVVATFNHDEAIDEDNYNNNTIRKSIKGSSPQVCKFNGYGASKKYENMICARYETVTYSYTVNGVTYSGSYQQCAEYKCQVNTYTLAYAIDTIDDVGRADLMGMWSGNYYGHKNLSVTYATESEPSAEKWKKKITSHKVPGIEQNKLKRVIRAGRSLQLYGTLKFEVRFESFDGEADLNSKVNKFAESLKRNLEVHGVDMGDGEVTNNKKQKKDTGQLDSSRAKVNGKYIKYEEKPMQKVRLGYAGHLNCIEIDVFSKEYVFEIPIKSKNLGGAQDTSSKGDYSTSKSYQVQSKDTDYYTNINTFNGIHALKMQLKIVGSDIDSAMGASKLCYTEPEVFGIYGNIYDDVRVDDITDKVKGKDKFDW